MAITDAPLLSWCQRKRMLEGRLLAYRQRSRSSMIKCAIGEEHSVLDLLSGIASTPLCHCGRSEAGSGSGDERLLSGGLSRSDNDHWQGAGRCCAGVSFATCLRKPSLPLRIR